MPYGEFPYSVDDKGRVIIPPQFRDFVEDGMVVTRGLERCLYIFPSRRWQELEERLEGLRGDVELPIPAASAVKIGGERAYRLHRRGGAVEMPVRTSRIDALDVIAYSGETVTLDLHVGSGTYIRSIAGVLGGHCRSLRRTEVGPFSVDEADPERVIPVDEALARLG